MLLKCRRQNSISLIEDNLIYPVTQRRQVDDQTFGMCEGTCFGKAHALGTHFLGRHSLRKALSWKGTLKGPTCLRLNLPCASYSGEQPHVLLPSCIASSSCPALRNKLMHTNLIDHRVSDLQSARTFVMSSSNVGPSVSIWGAANLVKLSSTGVL